MEPIPIGEFGLLQLAREDQGLLNQEIRPITTNIGKVFSQKVGLGSTNAQPTFPAVTG